ncbi:methionyl-tRNA synthetase [compost metagenome]
MIYAVLEALRQAVIMVSPFVPTLAEKMWAQIGLAASLESQRWDALSWGQLSAGTETKRLGPVYPRIEDELAGAAKKQ